MEEIVKLFHDFDFDICELSVISNFSSTDVRVTLLFSETSFELELTIPIHHPPVGVQRISPDRRRVKALNFSYPN